MRWAANERVDKTKTNKQVKGNLEHPLKEGYAWKVSTAGEDPKPTLTFRVLFPINSSFQFWLPAHPDSFNHVAETCLGAVQTACSYQTGSIMSHLKSRCSELFRNGQSSCQSNTVLGTEEHSHRERFPEALPFCWCCFSPFKTWQKKHLRSLPVREDPIKSICIHTPHIADAQVFPLLQVVGSRKKKSGRRMHCLILYLGWQSEPAGPHPNIYRNKPGCTRAIRLAFLGKHVWGGPLQPIIPVTLLQCPDARGDMLGEPSLI